MGVGERVVQAGPFSIIYHSSFVILGFKIRILRKEGPTEVSKGDNHPFSTSSVVVFRIVFLFSESFETTLSVSPKAASALSSRTVKGLPPASIFEETSGYSPPSCRPPYQESRNRKGSKAASESGREKRAFSGCPEAPPTPRTRSLFRANNQFGGALLVPRHTSILPA